MLKVIRYIAGIIYEVSSYEKGKGKNIIRSKTLWVNVLAILSILSSKYIGIELTTEDQTIILAAVNIFLRLITKEETGLIERPSEPIKGVGTDVHSDGY